MRSRVFLQGLISFLIVSFGQPSFVPWLGSLAAFVGYALFWRAIRIYPFAKQKFWRGCLWYGSVSLVQLSWMTSIEFQGVYILAVWLGISVCLGAQFGLLSILIPYNRSPSLARILAIASIWTLFEWTRYHFLCGYSWNLSGVALSNPYAIQCAAVFGILGLSFCVMLVNLLGLRAFTRKGIAPYMIWVGAALVPYLFGASHLAFHKKEMSKLDPEKQFSCLLVQTGLLPSEKTPLDGKIRAFVSPYDQWERILTYVKEKSDQNPDLIVLPEAVVPFACTAKIYDRLQVGKIFARVFGQGVPLSGSKVSNAFWAQTLADLTGSEVVLGLDHVEEGGSSFNSAFHAIPKGRELNRYDKRVLMPLAEYLPFRFLYPRVKSYGISHFFTHGKEAKIFEGKLPMSVSICYEETFPSKIREGRLQGAKLLVNVTNDGWYPHSRLPSQHFEHAKFRAVENGAALLRSCNTGVTAVVDSLGRTLGRLEDSTERGALFASFVPYEYPTLYTIWGNRAIVAISLFFLGLFAALRRQLSW